MLIKLKIIPFSIFSMQCSRPGMIYGIAICIFRRIQPKFQQKFANIMTFSTKSIIEKKNWVENVFWLFAHYVKYTLGYFKHYTEHYSARYVMLFIPCVHDYFEKTHLPFHISFDALDSLGWPRGRGANGVCEYAF